MVELIVHVLTFQEMITKHISNLMDKVKLCWS